MYDEAGLPVDPVLWLRLGANETNYYEVRLRVGADEWEKVEIDIDQLTRTKIDGPITTSEGYMMSVAGSPSITKVGRLTAGIENPAGRKVTGEVWIDDLHLTQVKRERGAAKRASLKLQLADLATLDADHRSLDATYRRLDQRGSSGATNSTIFEQDFRAHLFGSIYPRSLGDQSPAFSILAMAILRAAPRSR